jgi:hypothetical protein
MTKYQSNKNKKGVKYRVVLQARANLYFLNPSLQAVIFRICCHDSTVILSIWTERCGWYFRPYSGDLTLRLLPPVAAFCDREFSCFCWVPPGKSRISAYLKVDDGCFLHPLQIVTHKLFCCLTLQNLRRLKKRDEISQGSVRSVRRSTHNAFWVCYSRKCTVLSFKCVCVGLNCSCSVLRTGKWKGRILALRWRFCSKAFLVHLC